MLSPLGKKTWTAFHIVRSLSKQANTQKCIYDWSLYPHKLIYDWRLYLEYQVWVIVKWGESFPSFQMEERYLGFRIISCGNDCCLWMQPSTLRGSTHHNFYLNIFYFFPTKDIVGNAPNQFHNYQINVSN